MNRPENIILADCCAEEVSELEASLSRNLGGFCTKVHIANLKRSGKLSEIKRYAKYSINISMLKPLN